MADKFKTLTPPKRHKTTNFKRPSGGIIGGGEATNRSSGGNGESITGNNLIQVDGMENSPQQSLSIPGNNTLTVTSTSGQ